MFKYICRKIGEITILSVTESFSVDLIMILDFQ